MIKGRDTAGETQALEVGQNPIEIIVNCFMVDRAFLLTHQNSPVAYTDRNHISVWAKAALDRASAVGLLMGYKDGSIRPQANATRAEAVTVLLRALSVNGDYKQKVPDFNKTLESGSFSYLDRG